MFNTIFNPRGNTSDFFITSKIQRHLPPSVFEIPSCNNFRRDVIFFFAASWQTDMTYSYFLRPQEHGWLGNRLGNNRLKSLIKRKEKKIRLKIWHLTLKSASKKSGSVSKLLISLVNKQNKTTKMLLSGSVLEPVDHPKKLLFSGTGQLLLHFS